MASLQCNRPTNETCQQKGQGGSSLGQKMSEMASWVKGHNNGQQACKPSYQSTQAHSCQTHAAATSKTQTHCYSSQTKAHQTGQGLAKPQQAQSANKANGGHHAHCTHAHGHGQSHTKHQATNGVSCHCVNKTNGHHGHGHSNNHGHNHGYTQTTNGAAGTCEQKKERNLFRRIKDRLSGNSSCSDSSSSDSDSDNECCRKRKN